MAELQQLLDGLQTNGSLVFIPPAITTAEPPETSTGVSSGSKRLRRPSVRLVDVGGDQYQQVAYDSHVQRPKWRPEIASNRKESNHSGKSSLRTQPLTNLSSGYDNIGALDEEEPIAIGTLRFNKWVKSSETAAAKGVRSNWATKIQEPRVRVDHEDEKFSGREEEGFQDFSREDSESPLKEQTQETRNERPVFENRTRYENSREMSWQSGGRGRQGVKRWLQDLRLGRYWPMFEMHEVDEQVLPLLTLDDLKDMGINAVGSRRKMYCAIQKLGRDDFS